MKLDVATLAKEMSPGDREGEGPEAGDDLMEEGLGVAVDEIMDAFDKKDRNALMSALRNFVAMSRD